METIIDLEEGVEELNEEIVEMEQAQRELKEVLQEEYGGYHEIPPTVEQKWEQLQERHKNLIGQRNVLERVTGDGEESWGGSEIQIGELTGGQLASIQDGVDAATGQMRQGMGGQDMNGARVIAFLQEGVLNAPPNAPDNPRDWPWLLMLWTFEKLNNFNTVGDTDFQTTSLREAMESE